MKKNLLFVVDNLVLGGVTAVLINLLDALDYNKYSVDLLVLHYYEDMKVKVNPNVNIIEGDKQFRFVDESLGKILAEKNIKSLIGKLRLVFLLKSGMIKCTVKNSRKKLLKKSYDTEISFNDGFTEVFTACGDSPRKVAWMHIDISVHYDSARYMKLMKWSLKQFNMCVCVSDKVKQAYQDCFDLEQMITIHNVLNANSIKNKSEEETELPYQSNEINLVSVGRLCAQKNFSRFISVHKRLRDAGYPVHSYIVGDGLNKISLVNQIQKQNVESSFTLLGRKDNPFPYVKNADLFVLSSTHEGLPTVLTEAIILGTPCISTDVAGAREILQNKYGVIVKNSTEALYNGIKDILDNNKINDLKKALENYEFESSDIIRKIEEIL